MNAASKKVLDLVNQLPDADGGSGSKMTGPHPDKAEKLYRELFGGGREAIVALVDLLQVPGEGDDWKARYLLHGAAVFSCRKENEAQQKLLARVLAEQLGGDRPKPVQVFLVRELRTIAGPSEVGTLGKLVPDAELCEPVVQALLAIGQGAADHLRAALPGVEGKCRITVIQGLGVLGAAGGLDAVRKALTDEDRDTRLAAGFALANSGEGSAADALLAASDVEAVWERDQMTNHCLLLAEKLIAAGKKGEAMKIYKQLRDSRTAPEDRHQKQAATIGMLSAGR